MMKQAARVVLKTSRDSGMPMVWQHRVLISAGQGTLDMGTGSLHVWHIGEENASCEDTLAPMCSEARRSDVCTFARLAEPFIVVCEVRQRLAGIMLAAREGQTLKLWKLPV